MRNQRVTPLKRYTGSNLADMGRSAMHACRPDVRDGRLPALGEDAGREATRKACGVLVAMSQGQSWAPTPVDRDTVNVGSVPDSSRRLAIQVEWRAGSRSTEGVGTWRSRSSSRGSNAPPRRTEKPSAGPSAAASSQCRNWDGRRSPMNIGEFRGLPGRCAIRIWCGRTDVRCC